jgi:alkenylglycerophosphocholine hydrolase
MPAHSILFLVLATSSALLAIACEERRGGRHRAFYLLKPLTTLLVLLAVAAAPGEFAAFRTWVCLALLLSMLGDIALMFEGERAFLAGLGSFLGAHLLFVWAFLLEGRAIPPPWSLLPLMAGLAFFLWLLPRTGALRVPVMVYGAALSGMMLAAAARAELRQDVSGWLAAAGAVVFMVSDSALAVRQFRGPYPRAQTLILASYWLAIGLVAAAAVTAITLAPDSAGAHHKAVTTASARVEEPDEAGQGRHRPRCCATVL